MINQVIIVIVMTTVAILSIELIRQQSELKQLMLRSSSLSLANVIKLNQQQEEMINLLKSNCRKGELDQYTKKTFEI